MRRRRVFDDPEVLELLQDEPDLLGIVDALHATRHRRRASAVAAAAIAALVAGLSAALWPNAGQDVGQAALAAIGLGHVVHVVATTTVPDDHVVSLRTGVSRSINVTVETWYDEQARQLRARTHHGVAVSDDVVVTRMKAPPPQLAPGVALLSTRYRDALKARQATVVRRAQYQGRKALWLRIPGVRLSGEVILDRTYRPVAVRAAQIPTLWHVRTAESLGRTRSQFVVSESNVVNDGHIEAQRGVDPSTANAAAGFHGLWAPPGSGLSLESIVVDRIATSRASSVVDRTRGLYLRYRRGREQIDVAEALRPELAYQFADGRLTFNRNPIPSNDAIDIARIGDLYIGQFRFHGLYVRIRASSAADVLQAARALRPLPSP